MWATINNIYDTLITCQALKSAKNIEMKIMVPYTLKKLTEQQRGTANSYHAM
jgi:hypothetical protein